jgi:hypothetical protein
MIKRENIKQAIDAISKRDPEIGYSLNEMLGTGKIDIPSQADVSPKGEDPYFFFDKEKVSINKFLYFNEGTVHIEQGLLIKYGEMIKRQELLDRTEPPDYKHVVIEIHNAGLKFMVAHEIDYVLGRLGKRQEMPERAQRNGGLISFLKKIKQDTRAFEICNGDNDPAVLYKGIIDEDTRACFMCFPFCMDSLMQVADMNLEFFHVRFLLNCLVRGLEKNLFVCLADGKVLGLVYLTLKRHMFYKGLEIKFISTLRGKIGNEKEPTTKVPKGVGAFLVAGVWMLWKTGPANFKEIYLDSEIGARQFYEAVGFQSRGLSGYVLKAPKGQLVKAVLIMANNCKDPGKGIIDEIRSIIKKQIRLLRKKARNEKEKSARLVVIDSVKECLKPTAHQEFAETVFSELNKYGEKIPESRELANFASEDGSGSKQAHA